VVTVIVILVGLLVLIAVVTSLARGEPPPELPAPKPDTAGARELLFRPPRWRKEQARQPITHFGYNRPLDVQAVPEDGLLAPPRDIRGTNGDE
jgi:hypothetical protein